MILGATLTPALFWKRARAVHLILGGAALGSGVGILTHLYRSYTEGEDIKPEGMRDIAEGVIEGPKR